MTRDGSVRPNVGRLKWDSGSPQPLVLGVNNSAASPGSSQQAVHPVVRNARADGITPGVPAISGSLALNTKLTADPGTAISTYRLWYSYQWQRCDSSGASCTNIRGATQSSYTPEFVDVRPGEKVRVVVTASSIKDVASTTSAATAPVQGTSPGSLGAPAISGQAIDGGTLAATRGTWQSLEPYVVSYQWQRCTISCENVAGAHQPNYTPSPYDVGATLRAEVTARSFSGGTTTSDALTVVVAASPPRAAESPRVFLPGVPGAAATAVADLWFGTPPFELTYQWLRCVSGLCDPIPGATDVHYLPAALDAAAGVALAVRVTATNKAGSASAESKPLSLVAPAKLKVLGGLRTAATCNQNPVSTSAPTQNPAGGVHVGGSISIGSSGGWDPPWNSCANQQWRYAWFRDSALVIDQGTSTAGYGTSGADVGHTIQIQVTYEYWTDTYHGTSSRSDGTTVGNGAPNQPGNPIPNDGYIYRVSPGAAAGVAFTAYYTEPDGEPGYMDWTIERWNGSSYVVSESGRGLGDPGCYYGDSAEVGNGCWGRYFPSTSMVAGDYAWYVYGTDIWGWQGAALGLLGYSVRETPTVPTLSSPSNGQIMPTARPVLVATSTDAESDQIYYRIQVASDANFTTGSGGSLVGDFTSLASSNFNVPPGWTDPLDSSKTQSLKDGRTYYWRATASDGDGSAAGWSGTRSFAVRVSKFGTNSVWPMWSSGPLSINEATGNLVLSAPAPSFPTAAGTVGAAITYNSLDTTSHGLGQGWTIGSGVDPVKLIDHSLITGDGTDVVERVYPDGYSDFYQHVAGSTTYLPPSGSSSHLNKNPNPTDGTFTLVGDDGTVYSFSAADATTGVATMTSAESLSASAGVGRLSYSYDGQGRLTAITAKDGASTIATLTFTWGCSGALLCISGPDGIAWKYVGDGSGGTSGRLQLVNDQTRDLVKISYEASGRPQVFYNADDLSAASGSPDPNLTTGYNAAHDVRIDYDGSGRVATIKEESISGQTPSSSTWSFEYHPDITGATKTDPTRTAHVALASGSQRVSDGYTLVRTPCELATPTCAGADGTASIKVFYDGLGQLMERVNLFGKIAQAQYNEKSQFVWAEDADGNPADYSYDAVDNTLSSATGPDPDGAGPLPRPVTTYNYDETGYGSVSGSAYTPGTALHGLQASYYTTADLVSTANNGRPDAVTNELSSGSFAFSWGSTGPPALPGTTPSIPFVSSAISRSV